MLLQSNSLKATQRHVGNINTSGMKWAAKTQLAEAIPFLKVAESV